MGCKLLSHSDTSENFTTVPQFYRGIVSKCLKDLGAKVLLQVSGTCAPESLGALKNPSFTTLQITLFAAIT